MKNLIKVVILVMFLLSINNAQHIDFGKKLTEIEKQELISKIKDIYTYDEDVYENISFFKVKEAIPEILKYFWHPDYKNNLFDKLSTLGILEYENILSLANQVLDTLEVYRLKNKSLMDLSDNSLERVALVISFDKGDYSRVHSFIHRIRDLELKKLNVFGPAIKVLAKNNNFKEILKPYYKKLLYEKNFSSFYIEGYHELYGEPDLAFEKELMETHPNHDLRWIVFDKILRGQKSNEYYNFYKNLLDNPLNEKLYASIMSRILYY